MQRINTPDGNFHPGDAAAGIKGTILTSDWVQTVQEELVAIAEVTGVKLNPADNKQVLKAIQKLLADAVGQRSTPEDVRKLIAQAVAAYLPKAGGSLTGELGLDAPSVKSQLCLAWRIGSKARFTMTLDASDEAGGNAGSNFILSRYADSGAWVGTALTVNRASGEFAFATSPRAPTPGAADRSTLLANTEFVQRAVHGAFRKGEIKMWHGAVADIAVVWGEGWQLADGTNNTADLRDKFVVGAGKTYKPGATGGAASITLSMSQMPKHDHPIQDKPHGHVVHVNDPEHSHVVRDLGHAHSKLDFGPAGQSYFGNGTDNLSMGGGAGAFGFGGTPFSTSPAQTGIFINPARSGLTVSLDTAATGITGTQSAGGGAPIDTRPPYYALCFIEFVGP